MRDKARRVAARTPAPPAAQPAAARDIHAEHAGPSQRPVSTPLPLLPARAIASLQQTVGNRGAQRLLARQSAAARRSGPGAPAAGPGRAAPLIQRTLWVASAALEWEARDATGDEIEPEEPPTTPGQIFDDQTGALYASQQEYDSAQLTASVFGAVELPEDDGSESDYEMEEEEGSDDEELSDEGQTSDTTTTMADAQEMTLEERREEEQRGLKRPRETTKLTLTPGHPRHTITSNVKLKRKGSTTIEQRSPASGPVTITLETVELWVNDKKSEHVRPVEIVGMVEPTTTTGRGGAPDPLSGTQIYMGNQGQLKGSIPAERNMGMPDTERGHIMALELGGPDIPENIVPQWAKFQGSGEWRRMEVAVLEAAKELPKGQLLKYHVVVSYKETGSITPTLRSFGVPSHFRATTQVCDEYWKPVGAEVEVFNQGQAQDITDNKLAEREMSRLDGPDWDRSLDSEEPKKKRARTTASTPKKNTPTSTTKKKQTKKPRRKKGGQ